MTLKKSFHLGMNVGMCMVGYTIVMAAAYTLVDYANHVLSKTLADLESKGGADEI